MKLRRFGTADYKKKERRYTSVWTNEDGKRFSCSVAECSEPVKKAGYCNAHYHRKLRYGDPCFDPIKDKQRICVQPDCKQLTTATHGFCIKHARKIYADRSRGTKQRLARLAIWYAENKRLIERPKNCVVCGSDKRIEAHHEDYDKPLWVIYLCKKCHANAHSSRKRPLDPSLFATPRRR